MLSKVLSPMTHSSFSSFRESFQHHVRENAIGGSGKTRLTVKQLTASVNQELALEGHDQYAPRAVCKRLHFLVCNVETVRKCFCVDGHELAGVIADRARFGKELDEVQPFLLTIDDETLQVRENPNAKYIVVSQDEKIHHSSDVRKRYWSSGEFTAAFNESHGRTVMTSDFLSEVSGFVKYHDRRAGSILDVTVDGYYENKRCLVKTLLNVASLWALSLTRGWSASFSQIAVQSTARWQMMPSMPKP